jgi:hypothetical protein
MLHAVLRKKVRSVLSSEPQSGRVPESAREKSGNGDSAVSIKPYRVTL